MASLLGSAVPLDCPACDEPMTVPLRQLDVDDGTVTVALDLGPFREHIATVHNAKAVTGGQPPEPVERDGGGR